MMFKKKPRFRIIVNSEGNFLVQEWKPVWEWPHDGYAAKSYHYTLEEAERAVERLARAGTVIAEYDYPPLVKRAL